MLTPEDQKRLIHEENLPAIQPALQSGKYQR
jgi:hypothetical protein